MTRTMPIYCQKCGSEIKSDRRDCAIVTLTNWRSEKTEEYRMICCDYHYEKFNGKKVDEKLFYEYDVMHRPDNGEVWDYFKPRIMDIVYRGARND